MKSLLFLVLISVALVRAYDEMQGHDSSLDEVFKNPRSGRMSYEAKMQKISPTVAFSCASFFKAIRVHAYSNIINHFYKKSLIIYNSQVPAKGVYRGKRGALQLGARWSQMAQVSESQYEIKHIDEARGICIVDTHAKLSFRRNNNSLALSSTTFIKFKFGKIKLMNIVDHDFNAITTAFQTKAENKFDQVVRAFFGGELNAMDPFIAEDFELQLPNLYPALQPQRVEGKNVSLALRGKEGLGIFASLAGKLIVNRTLTVKYLWGNDTSVISAWILKPKADFEVWNLRSRKMAAHVLTIMYVCSDFNEKGMMKSFRLLFNRPFLPWQTYQVGVELKKTGELREAERNATALREAAVTGIRSPVNVTGLTGVTGR